METKHPKITDIDLPEQLVFLKKGERISIEGLVKFSTRTETKPSLPDEFVIKNKEGAIETLKEMSHENIARSIYEVEENVIKNFNIILYNKIKPLYSYYRAMLDDFRSRFYIL